MGLRGSGFRVRGFGFRGFRFDVSVYGVSGRVFEVRGFRVGFGYGVTGSWFRDSGFLQVRCFRLGF